MKVKGRVHSVGQTRQVSEKFQTREIVIVTDDKFPQYIPCQLSQDKVSLADNLKIGEAVAYVSPAPRPKHFAVHQE